MLNEKYFTEDQITEFFDYDAELAVWLNECHRIKVQGTNEEMPEQPSIPDGYQEFVTIAENVINLDAGLFDTIEDFDHALFHALLDVSKLEALAVLESPNDDQMPDDFDDLAYDRWHEDGIR